MVILSIGTLVSVVVPGSPRRLGTHAVGWSLAAAPAATLGLRVSMWVEASPACGRATAVVRLVPGSMLH